MFLLALKMCRAKKFIHLVKSFVEHIFRIVLRLEISNKNNKVLDRRLSRSVCYKIRSNLAFYYNLSLSSACELRCENYQRL